MINGAEDCGHKERDLAEIPLTPIDSKFPYYDAKPFFFISRHCVLAGT